jgi:hypothetical protein
MLAYWTHRSRRPSVGDMVNLSSIRKRGATVPVSGFTESPCCAGLAITHLQLLALL